MRAISVLSQKGGTGKTSLSVNLAHALAREGQRVLLIDCDIQANASLLLDQVEQPTLTDVLRDRARLTDAIRTTRPGIDLVPSDRDLDSASRHIVAEGRRGYAVIRRQMVDLDGYDVVFFDHAPSYTPVSEAILMASTEMLIPCELSPYAMHGLLAMFSKLEETLDEPLTMTGIVPFKVDQRYAMHARYLESLRTRFGELVLPSIRTDATPAKAQSVNQTVFEYDPHCKAAVDITAVAHAMMRETVAA